MAVKSTTIKIDETVKRQAQALFADLGLDMSTAINIFLRQSIKEQAIPFRIGASAPNAETLEALAEVERMKQNPSAYRGYKDVEEMMETLPES